MRDNFNVHEWRIDQIRKENINKNKGRDTAREFISKMRDVMRSLSDDELDTFRKDIAQAFDLNVNESINEEPYTVAGKSVTLNKGKKSDGTDWTVTFPNGKETSLSDVLSLIKPFPKGITKETVNEGEAQSYKKGDKLKIKLKNGKKFDVVFDSYSRTKGVALGKFKDGSGEYNTKPFDLDTIVESVNEQPDVLNKIADMFDRKYPHLTFDVNTMVDRIDVRGDQSDLMKFGEELHGEKIFDYEVFHTDDDDRGEIVRIIKSDRINEKKEKADRCLRIARREIPQSSAYRSGLIVKCRKGMIWKDKK